MSEQLRKLVMARRRGWITSLEFLCRASEVIDGASVSLLKEFNDEELADLCSVLLYHGVPQEGALTVNGEPVFVSGWKLLASNLSHS